MNKILNEEKKERILINNEIIETNKKVLKNLKDRFKDIEEIDSGIGTTLRIIDFFVKCKKQNKIALQNEKMYTYVKIDDNILADNLLDKKLVKKQLFINFLIEKNERNEKIYYPLVIDVFCDTSFDNKKIYSFDEIESLIKEKQIVYESKPYLGREFAKKENEVGDLRKIMKEKLTFEFNFGKIKYVFEDNLKIVEEYKKELHKKIVSIDEVNDYLISPERGITTYIERVMSDLSMIYDDVEINLLKAMFETSKRKIVEAQIENKKLGQKENFEF